MFKKLHSEILALNCDVQASMENAAENTDRLRASVDRLDDIAQALQQTAGIERSRSRELERAVQDQEKRLDRFDELLHNLGFEYDETPNGWLQDHDEQG